MAEVLIYTKNYCGYCSAAKRLLDNKGAAYDEIDVTTDRAKWSEMVDRSGGMTVPQIFISGQSIGGYSELAALDRSGKLDPMLGLEPDAAGREPSKPDADGSSGWLHGLWNRVGGGETP